MKKLFFVLLYGAMMVSFTACEKEDVESENATTINGHQAVDLGLPSGTLWATCNIGATNPEDRGDYFAWGETQTKENYTWDNYKFGTYKYSDGSGLTKYNLIDNKVVLDLSDDAAHVHWGGGWRMPTEAEQNELRTECTWEWDTHKQVFKVTGKNGNFIFLPAAGLCKGTHGYGYGGTAYGYYWSASCTYPYPQDAYTISFYASYLYEFSLEARYQGLPIRPVCSSVK